MTPVMPAAMPSTAAIKGGLVSASFASFPALGLSPLSVKDRRLM